MDISPTSNSKVSVAIITVFLVLFAKFGYTQSITVSGALTQTEAEDYVQNVLLGSCVTASNVVFIGDVGSDSASIGEFDGLGTALGLNSGLILSSGRASFAVGPDNSNSLGFTAGRTGDPDLTVLAGGFNTFDATILEFDFIPQSDTIEFNYIFGSEEYPEYVNSGYNDVFGFLLSGPGISGPYTGGAENIALVPGATVLPVTIDNVNNGYSSSEPPSGPCENCAYYVDNSSGPAVQYDGHTTVLTAKAGVTPCQTYHIKIAIADAGDGALDSGVFLEAGSFSATGQDPVELESISGIPGVYEGCSTASFVFRRLIPGQNSNALTANYTVSGSATPGVDYTALPGTITIPAGQDSIVLNIDALLDFTTEGPESVVLNLDGGGCTCTAPPSVSMDILDNDVQLSLTTAGTTTICQGQSANLTATPTGSIAPYVSGWDSGAPSGNNVAVTPDSTTVYTYTVADACGGQSLSSTETVTVIRADFTVDSDQQCFDGNTFSFQNNGATGGTVSHFWEFGDGNTSTTENPTHSYAIPGNYTVTHNVIYIAAGCTASVSAPISVFDEPVVSITIDQIVACVGGLDGALSTTLTGGTGPFSYLWSPNNEVSTSISNLAAGNYGVTVTDSNGCTSSDTETLVQNDGQLPTAACQNATVYLNAVGVATISATVVDNGSIDNCGIASLVASPNSFSCANVGANPVVLTVTDINSNVNTCNATVTVLDTISPTAVCQDLSVALDGAGLASILAAQIDNGSTDNCAIQSVVVTPSAFDCSDVGVNPVTLTVTDVNGNASSCTASVTVTETTNPTALCQDITVELDATGNVSITGNQVDNGSNDNCGISSLSVTPSDFDCTNIGANPVVLTVTDGSGNTASCNATVTVEDNMPPVMVCQNVSVQLDASGFAAIVASDVDGGTTDNCAVDNLSIAPSSFTCNEVGNNSVVLTATDVNGNTSNCSAIVAVFDTVSPTAVCQDITVQLDPSGNISIDAAQIDNGSSDNCAVQSISVTPNTINCASIGASQVELTVTDVNSNTSTCNAQVTVLENTPPTAVCQDIVVQLDATGTVTILASQVDGGSADNCGGVTLDVNPATFDCSNIGDNPVTLTVTDDNGNTASCTATVTVQDNVAPNAICQDITILIDATGTATVVAADIDGGSTDNCVVNNLSVTPNALTCADVGNNSVTLTVTDTNGNSSTCNATVTVQDNLAPSALCQDITVQLDVNGDVSITPADIDNGSSNVCGVGSLTLDVSSFDCSNLGLNTVVLTVSDNSGNAATCSAQVTVQDGVAPTAVCQNSTVYLDGNGAASINPASVDGGSTDNCAIDSYSLSQSDFLCIDAGQSVVTLTVVDAGGNTDDCIAVVTVLDSISPVINMCPSDVVVVPDGSNCSPAVTWTEPTESDNCSVTMTSNFSSGDNFPVGTTTVTYQAEDSSGNTTSCSFTVTVEPSPVLVTVSSPVGVCGYNISCNGAEDGEATASASGGCLPYSFAWSDGQTTQTAVGLAAGQHSIVVTDANGTQTTETILLTEPVPLVTDTIASPEYAGETNISCAGATDGAINVNITGGADCQPYVYNWSGPNGFVSANEDLTGLVGGTYVLTVTDESGCTHIDSILLSEPEPLVLESFPTTYNGFNISCAGLENGFINLEVQAGSAPYSYQWSNGEITQDIDSLPAGTYNVVVTDTNGCQESLPTVLNEPPVLSVVPTDTNSITCNGSENGQFVVQALGGVPSYSYLWSNGDFDPILNAVGVGIYQVVVTDLNGCQDSLELEMTAPELLEATVSVINDATCFGGSDGVAIVAASGGVGPYSYFWPSINESGATVSNLSAGENIFEVTDANGCTYSDTVLISEPDQVILVTSADTIVCPGTLVSLFAQASGGGGTYLITWEDGEGFGTSFENYITGTTNISVIAVDQNGCEAAPNSVIVTTHPSVQASFDETILEPCVSPFEFSFNNTSVNAVSYEWSFGNGDSSNALNPIAAYDSSASYVVSLIVTSAEGCSDSSVQTIVIDPLPVANFEIPNPDGCFPILVGLFNQSTPATSYFWDFGDGVTSNIPNPYHLYEEPGSYDVTLIITNSNGCMDTLTVDSAVFAYPRPTAAFTTVSLSFPEPGSEYTFINNSSGGDTYLWTFGNGDQSDLFEPTHNYPEFGSYDIVLRVFNEYGCLDTAKANVFIELTSGLFVPNAMAIGESGDAGQFLPKGEGLREYHAWVYDNWGNLMWESTELIGGSPSEGWNGIYKGRQVPQGAYTWKVEATFKDGLVWEGMPQANGKKSTTGSITVLY